MPAMVRARVELSVDLTIHVSMAFSQSRRPMALFAPSHQMAAVTVFVEAEKPQRRAPLIVGVSVSRVSCVASEIKSRDVHPGCAGKSRLLVGVVRCAQSLMAMLHVGPASVKVVQAAQVVQAVAVVQVAKAGSLKKWYVRRPAWCKQSLWPHRWMC